MSKFRKLVTTRSAKLVAILIALGGTSLVGYQNCGKFSDEGSSVLSSRVPRLVGITGTLSAYYIDTGSHSELGRMGLHLTTDAGKRYDVQVLSGPSRVGMSGAQIASANESSQDITDTAAANLATRPTSVTVRGSPQGGQLQIAQSDILVRMNPGQLTGSGAQTLSQNAGTFSAVTGVRRAAVFLVDVEGAPANCTKEQTEKNFFGGAPSVRSVYSNITGGAANFQGKVFGPYRLSGIRYTREIQEDMTKLNQYLNDIVNAAVQSATQDGYRQSDYDHDFFMLPMPENIAIAGYAAINGRWGTAWGVYCNDLDTLVHELGHNYGLPHSSMRYANGDIEVYRDNRCAMSATRIADKNLLYFNPIHQSTLQISNPTEVVTESGNYDVPDFFNPSVHSRKVIRFRNYWLTQMNGIPYVHFLPPPDQQYQAPPSMPPQPVGTLMQQSSGTGPTRFNLPDSTVVTATPQYGGTMRFSVQAPTASSPAVRFWAWQADDKSDLKALALGETYAVDPSKPLGLKWSIENIQSFTAQPSSLSTIMGANMAGEARFDVSESIRLVLVYRGNGGEQGQFTQNFDVPVRAPSVFVSEVLPTENGRWRAKSTVDNAGSGTLSIGSKNCTNDLRFEEGAPTPGRSGAMDLTFSLLAGPTDQTCIFTLSKAYQSGMQATQFNVTFSGAPQTPTAPTITNLQALTLENERAPYEIVATGAGAASDAAVNTECSPNGTEFSISAQAVSATSADTRVIRGSITRPTGFNLQCRLQVRFGSGPWSPFSNSFVVPEKAVTVLPPAIAHVDVGTPSSNRVPIVLGVDNLLVNLGYRVESTCGGIQVPNEHYYNGGRYYVKVSLPQGSSEQSCQFRIQSGGGPWSNYSTAATIPASSNYPPQITDQAPAGRLGDRVFLTVVGIRFSPNEDNRAESNCPDLKIEYDGEPGMPVPGYRQMNFSFPGTVTTPCQVRIKRPDSDWSNWSVGIIPR